jgi:hypothetical protein
MAKKRGKSRPLASPVCRAGKNVFNGGQGVASEGSDGRGESGGRSSRQSHNLALTVNPQCLMSTDSVLGWRTTESRGD